MNNYFVKNFRDIFFKMKKIITEMIDYLLKMVKFKFSKFIENKIIKINY